MRAEEAATDHVADAEVGLDDGKNMLTKMEKQLFDLRANAKVNERKLADAEAQAEKVGKLIQRKAAAAADAKGQTLAKHKEDLGLLVEEQKIAKGSLDEAKVQVQNDQNAISAIQKKCNEVKGKLRRAESRLATKKAELATAEVTSQLEQGYTTFNKDNPLDALDALDDHVDKKKAEAEAAEEMSGMKSENMMERMESELDGSSTDDEVAALIAAAGKK